MQIGRLEIKFWKDTGQPGFRIVGSKKSGVPYKWYCKAMSYWTLWIAWRMSQAELPDWYKEIPSVEA